MVTAEVAAPPAVVTGAALILWTGTRRLYPRQHMSNSHLRVTPLEDRATPSSTKETPVGTSCPPQDPMDNPPPAQPAPKDESGPGKGGKKVNVVSTAASDVTSFTASTLPTVATTVTKAAYTL